MDKNKIVIENCPNFYKIVNFDYFEDDNFTACLIKLYRDYIFSVNVLDNDSLNKIRQLDLALSKYIDDYIFRKTMKYELSQVRIETKEEMLSKLINAILGIFDKYEEGKTRNIYIARWI